MADEPTGTRNNYLNNMLDGYQAANGTKKVRNIDQHNDKVSKI